MRIYPRLRDSKAHKREYPFAAEREYLLGYYSLAREGKTNYTATTAMLAYLGTRGQEPAKFFKTYSVRLLSVPPFP